MYNLFRRLNRARQTAISSFPSFFSLLSHPAKLNAHVISIRKSPLLSILSNYGSRSAPVVIYVPPSYTAYKPLMVVIDIISGQLLGTDQKGGLSVPIVNGEPRVFLPLVLHRKQGDEVKVGEWYREPMVLDTSVKGAMGGDRQSPGGGAGAGGSPGSPGSPGRHSAKTPSFGRVMSWLGMGSGGKG